MPKSKMWKSVLGAIAITLVASSCSSGSDATTTTSGSSSTTSAVSGDPVKIGLIAQEEELIAYPEMAAGARAGAAYVNAELGGVSGAPIEVEVCSAGDQPESTVSCAQKFANDDSIKIVLMGTLNSSAGNEVLVGVGKPVFSLSNDIPDIITEGVWAFDPGAVVLAAGLFAFASENLGVSTYSLLVPDDPFYTEVVVPLVFVLSEVYGLTPVGDAVKVPLEGDPTGPVTAAVDQGGEVLIAVADSSQCVGIANAAKSVGVAIPVVTADTCMTNEVIGSGALDGWYGISACEAPVAPDQRSDSAFTDIVTKYGDGDPLLNASFGCWGVVNVIIAADVLGLAGGAAATSEDINGVLAAGYTSEHLPAYPAITCPGPDPFIGACLTTATMVKITGSTAVLEALVPVDVGQLAFLLEG